MTKIKVAVTGATGYGGEELLRILIDHPHVEIVYVSAQTHKCKIQDFYPFLKGRLDLQCDTLDPRHPAVQASDVIFLPLPHGVPMGIVPELKNKCIIDISADYRLKNPAWYPQYYKFPHKDPANLQKAVYGLTEYARKDLPGARLVANPGCYPTATLLALLPLIEAGVSWTAPCIIDAKSGVSGAGRAFAESLSDADQKNFKAYKVLGHQHEGEIRQGLEQMAAKVGKGGQAQKVPFVFTPHLLPINRGIITTIYVTPTKPVSAEALRKIFVDKYTREPFVKVCPDGEFPELKAVNGTNQCHIGVGLRKDVGDTGVIVIVSAIDNLLKGASGQAVQNMNLVFGFDEKEGLN